MTTTTSEAFGALSDGMAAAVETAAVSVVTVRARRRIPATGIVWSADGLIVTADHVIEDEERITVVLPDGASYPATLLGRDPGADLALLRIEGITGIEAPTTAATLAPEAAPRIGQFALAIGRPGAEIEASIGVVSAVGGPWRSRSGTRVAGYLRTDTTMFPGFSGGPLIDAHGRVLGMNSSRFPERSIAVPAAAVATLVALLQQHGRVQRAYIGIASQAVALPAPAAGGQQSGLLIVRVEAESPAAAAGLLVGDILLGIEGAPTSRSEELQDALGPERVGAAVRVQLLRGGVPHEVTVTLGERA